MNHKSWKIALCVAVIWFFLAAPLRAQWTDSIGCTDATLNGNYAFTLHGESLGVIVYPLPGSALPPRVVPFTNPLLADGVAMTQFDGNKGLTQVDFVMRNGTSAATPSTPTTSDGFRSGETGSYSVNFDCTGRFVIRFPDTTEIDVAFVIGDFGQRIRTVVTRQHVPQLPPAILPVGVTCDAGSGGCDLGVQIRSDGVKSESAWE